MLTEQGQAIIFRQGRLPLALRLFTLVLGLGVGIAIPVPFVIYPDWGTPSLTLLVAVFCIVFPAAVGAVFVVMALASSTELRLDPATGAATRILRGPVLRRRETYPLSALEPPVLIMRDSEEGAYPVLRMRLPKWPVVEMCDFSGRAEAEAWQARIASLLAKA
jgi:hypothetical protein